MAKMLSAPGITVAPTADLTTLTPGEKAGGRALNLYQVVETNTSATVLFSTANFINTSSGGTPPLSAEDLPYGNKLFIVFQKGGVGAVLQARQIGNTNVVGDYAIIQN
ncbi:MAG: hypothetical protein JHC52_02085 [Chthoniobacterales bacterium]|nr:hypothetical protein [Chthoniobacterales bacterium]